MFKIAEYLTQRKPLIVEDMAKVRYGMAFANNAIYIKFGTYRKVKAFSIGGATVSFKRDGVLHNVKVKDIQSKQNNKYFCLKLCGACQFWDFSEDDFVTLENFKIHFQEYDFNLIRGRFTKNGE